jgi:hypothetical protein
MLTPQEKAVLDHLIAKQGAGAGKKTIKSVFFINSTPEDFTGYWDGVDYNIPAGEKILVEDWLAEHLAKHLATREINKGNTAIIKSGGKEEDVVFNPKRKELESSFISPIVAEAQNTIKLNIESAKALSTEESSMTQKMKERPKKTITSKSEKNTSKVNTTEDNEGEEHEAFT